MHAVPAVLMRGGTSKCWVFRSRDLDVPGMTRDEVLLRLFGSPDPRQIDGIGGATSTTSKAVILEPSSSDGVDVEYTFAQVGIDEAKVDWGSNCGNCSAVVGAFAVEEGWVAVGSERTTVRIHNTNTDQLIVQHLPTRDGAVDDRPTSEIPGVSFPGASVLMGFVDPGGRTTGRLLPTGNPVDRLPGADSPDGHVAATLVDAGAPVVLVHADSVGLTGGEAPSDLDARPELLSLLERIRRQGAVAMGLAETAEDAARAIPKMGIVAAGGPEGDLVVRMMSMGRPHPAVPITGSVALTMAARERGTIPYALVRDAPQDSLRLVTPSGVLTAFVEDDGTSTTVGVERTYRWLARGQTYLPPAGAAELEPTDTVEATHVEPQQWSTHHINGDAGMKLTSTPSHTDAGVIDELPPRRTVLGVVAGFAALAVGGSAFGGDLLNPPASTGDGDYAGETLEFLIPLAQGGGTDTWARFIGTELSTALPGSPGFAPVNDEGGEGITGSNHFMTDAEPDGTRVLVSTATTVVPYLLGLKSVQYDFTRMRPVVANGTGAVVYVRTETGVGSVRDLLDRDRPLSFGGITATGLDVTTLLAFDLLELDVDAVFGFEGRGPVNLALQRGEIDLDYQTTSTYDAAVTPMVDKGTAVPLFSLGQVDPSGRIVRDPNFPDLPTVVEAYEKATGRSPKREKVAAYTAILGLTYTYQKALWVPEETSDVAVDLLRGTCQELGKDPKFTKSAKEVLGGYPLDAAADLDERLGKAYVVDEDVRRGVLDLLSSTYDITID